MRSQTSARGDKMITITLEGNSWGDILQEMTIIQEAAKCPRINDLPGQADIAKMCSKCQDDRHNKLMGILGCGYGLGLEEVAEILERVR